MANLKDIRERIKSVKSIKQVTKAMKMVAAAKMRRAQENMEKARPYSEKISDLVNTFLLLSSAAFATIYHESFLIFKNEISSLVKFIFSPTLRIISSDSLIFLVNSILNFSR